MSAGLVVGNEDLNTCRKCGESALVLFPVTVGQRPTADRIWPSSLNPEAFDGVDSVTDVEYVREEWCSYCLHNNEKKKTR